MKSETIGKLSNALCKVQGEISFALKDSANPFFKSKYADLESVWRACNESLVKNEISIIQSPNFDGDNIYLSTILTHSSGEWIESRCPLLLKARDPQALGSAITYARRYSLAAMVGVIQTDDDGESAMGRIQKDPIVNENQVKILKDYCSQLPGSEKSIFKRLSINNLNEMKLKDYDAVYNWLKKKQEGTNG